MVSGEVKQHFSGRIEDKKGSCSKMKKTKYVRTFFLCSVILWTLLVSGSDCRDLGKTLRATQSETKQLLRKKRDSGMATPSGISQGLPSMSLNSHGQRGEAPSVAKSGKDIFKQLLLQSRESESVMALVNSEDALSLSLGRRGHPGSSLHEVESDQTETKQHIRKRRELDIETDPKLFKGKLSSVPTTPRQNGGLRNILKSGGDNMKPLLRKIRESESLPASVSSADVSSSSPAGKGNSTQNAQSAKPIKIRDHMGPSASYSIITQSILTFVTVFVFGCAVILAVFAWKRFTDSSFR